MAMSSETNTGSRPTLFDELRDEGLAFWRHMPDKGLFFGLLAAWLALFHFLGNSVFGYIDTPSLLRWMYHEYDTSADYGHGMLMPFVVIGLLYWKRAELIGVKKEVWWPAVGIVAMALVLHLFGYLVQFPQVSIVAFFVGIYGLTGVVWGRGWLWRTLFPMGLFVFSVPLGTLGEAITVPMRMLASYLTSGVCGGLLGIDVIRDGSELRDASGRFNYEVAAACGGIRSLISLLGLSTVFAFLTFKGNTRRLLMILSAFPLAIAGNVFRLVCIIVAAEAFGQDAGSFVHDHLGMLPYLPAFAGLFLLGHLLRERIRPTDVNLEEKTA
jgi:exosortase